MPFLVCNSSIIKITPKLKAESYVFCAFSKSTLMRAWFKNNVSKILTIYPTVRKTRHFSFAIFFFILEGRFHWCSCRHVKNKFSKCSWGAQKLQTQSFSRWELWVFFAQFHKSACEDIFHFTKWMIFVGVCFWCVIFKCKIS